jgi:hypothetical protein
MLTLTIMSPGQVLEASGNIPSPSTRRFHLCHFPMSKPHCRFLSFDCVYNY